ATDAFLVVGCDQTAENNGLIVGDRDRGENLTRADDWDAADSFDVVRGANDVVADESDLKRHFVLRIDQRNHLEFQHDVPILNVGAEAVVELVTARGNSDPSTT